MSHNIRALNQLARVLSSQSNGLVGKQLVPAVAVLSARHLTNRSKTNQQHVSIESTSSSTSQFNYSPQVANLDLALAEVKVFQDEQIIQLTYKSGKTVNYSMGWLRNHCSCPACVSNKFGLSTQHAGSLEIPKSEKIRVSRIRCKSESELEVEWIDSQYQCHMSKYNVTLLNVYNGKTNQ